MYDDFSIKALQVFKFHLTSYSMFTVIKQHNLSIRYTNIWTQSYK